MPYTLDYPVAAPAGVEPVIFRAQIGQAMASFNERFACDEVMKAIENEFAMGTIERCQLLGKPTPVEEHRATLTAGDGK